MKKNALFICLALFAMFGLVACSSTAPRQIGSYPLNPPEAPTAIARESYHPIDIVADTADLVVAVSDVDAAAGRATELAYDHGGYPASSQSWFQDGQKHIMLELSVPARQYNALRRDLLALGTFISDRVANDIVSPGDTARRTTQVTVHLQPALTVAWPDSVWNPARTFMSAYGVVAAIFRVVVDIMIWVVVVIGPFALIGLVLWFIVRKARKPG